ncbi:MAG TPA: hypothetical protein VF520_00655 [Thermoleophilaceae bacterium]|jgi:hypothetical protein
MRTVVTTAVALVAAAVMPLPAAAEEAPPANAQWRGLASAMARPWPAIQEPGGSLPDYMDGYVTPVHVFAGTRYGDAVMGYGLIEAGLRDGDRETLDAGIRSVSYATDPDRARQRDVDGDPSVFEQWGVAAAYNLLRARLPDDPAFERRRPEWESWLARIKAVRFGTGRRFSNHDLVEACVVMELLATGLRSDVPGAVLGSGRRLAERHMLALVNRTVPTISGHRDPAFISDPPDQPPAYQALSFGLYAHLVQRLGERAGRPAVVLLRRVARASWRMAAPDGDLAAWGRSQELAWVYSATAYGASIAAGLPDTPPVEAARFRELALRSLDRLRSDYPVTVKGQVVTPSLRAGPRVAAPFLDRYVGAPSMGGLALVFLNLALDEPAASLDGPALDLASDADASILLGREAGRFGVARRGRLWFAVRASRMRSGRLHSDLRYDLGLVALKRLERGAWRDVVPHRPNTEGEDFRDSIGPVLLTPGGGRLEPAADRIKATATGGFTLHGAWYLTRKRPALPAVFAYEPVGCGVALSFRAPPGARLELSQLFATRPVVGERTIEGLGQRLKANVPLAVRLERGYGSAVDPRLIRARMVATAPRSGRLRFLTC